MAAEPVFEITPQGKLISLHEFSTTATGIYPAAPVVQGKDGALYGTTSMGGKVDLGTGFRFTPGGKQTTLGSFGGTTGYNPQSKLLQASDGNFYGTTPISGSGNGSGTIFRMTKNGVIAVLHEFAFSDGAAPYAQLVEGPDGSLYGTTTQGGAFSVGTVFKITLAGVLTTLHSFQGSDRSYPTAGLVLASDGNFYGTTAEGGYTCGTTGCGTIFQISPEGVFATLHNFLPSEGYYPLGGLVQATDGSFYGTTTFGGIVNKNCSYGCGNNLQPYDWTGAAAEVTPPQAAGEVGLQMTFVR